MKRPEKELADLREEVIDAGREAAHSSYGGGDPYCKSFRELVERLEDEGHGWERHVPRRSFLKSLRGFRGRHAIAAEAIHKRLGL